jgi:ADP-ribose pyrophosphatase
MSYEVLGSQVPFDGKAIRVRVDQLRHSSGREMRYELIEHVGSVVMIPLDEQDQVWFVRQYRHPVGQRMLELPAGTLDHDEKPVDCAVRECREEIGMSPARMTDLGGCYLAPGYSNEYARFFLAEDLSPDPLEMEADEDIIVEKLSLREVKGMVSRGEINDAKTIVGISLVLAHRGDGFAG